MDDCRFHAVQSYAQLGKPEKLNDGKPVMRAREPEENPNFGFGGWLSVLHVDGRFRMWYSCRYSETEGYITAYAESTDGIHWTRPAVGRNGTNEIFTHSGGFICSFDPHETDSQHRYKAAYGGKEIKACLAHSPNGIHWTPYNDGKPVTGRAADTLNQIVWGTRMPGSTGCSREVISAAPAATVNTEERAR